VRELKSILLKILDQPFFFDFNINDSTIQELINKSLNNPINITFDYNIFNLLITDDFGDNHLIVKGLSKN
jgi:hypothetical protein